MVFITRRKLTVFYPRTSERQPDFLAVVQLAALEPTHHVETVFKGLKLDETHPLVLVVLFPLHLSDPAAHTVAQLSDFCLSSWVDHRHVEHLRRRIRIRRPGKSITLVLVLLLVLRQLL